MARKQMRFTTLFRTTTLAVSTAVLLATGTAHAQQPAAGAAPPSPMTEAPADPNSASAIIAAPKAIGAVQIRAFNPDSTQVKRVSQDFFPTVPFAAGSAMWQGDCQYGRYYFLCHDPLYFEDGALERYGCTLPCYAQPAVSAGKFFASVPLAPVKFALNTWNNKYWCRDYMGNLRPGYLACGCKPCWCEQMFAPIEPCYYYCEE